MDLLLWLTVSFMVIGFIVIASMKKRMEKKVALIIENEESIESQQISNKPVIWWIAGSVAWGVISMYLVVWCFSVYT